MYNQIAANKRKTWVLIFLVCAVILGISSIYPIIIQEEVLPYLMVGAVVSLVYTTIGYFVSDKVALKVNGAKLIAKADAPDLYNMVENLCIANGQPMPKIYVMQDPAPNAFATGRDPEHASIAFTTGLLQLLDKQELEGVTAHELSHVKNYDIRVMTLVVVLVGAVTLLADLFLHGTRIKSSGKNNAGILAIVGLVLVILSPIFAELVKLAVSRSREYLADASGALLTRYPEGLAQALEKLKSSQTKMQHVNPATAHLFIANPFGADTKTRTSKLKNLFSTHPPLEERIKKLREMGS